MPRRSRIVIGGYPRHIIRRGHNRQVVFASDYDYLYYLDNPREWKEKLGCRVYAYCLMTNHVHLIIDPGNEEGNLAQLMKRVGGRQTRYVNKMERRKGSEEAREILSHQRAKTSLTALGITIWPLDESFAVSISYLLLNLTYFDVRITVCQG